MSLTQLVSEGLIVLWLLYYLLSSRYLAPLNSLKWCVDSENKPGEQTPEGIQGSDCTASKPLLGSGYNGGLEGRMDARTKALESCQCISAPEVSLNILAGMSPHGERFYKYLILVFSQFRTCWMHGWIPLQRVRTCASSKVIILKSVWSLHTGGCTFTDM